MVKRIFILLPTLPLLLLAILMVACGSAPTATISPQATPVPTVAPVTEPPISPTAASTSTPVPTNPEIESVFIQLADPLDEPQFYCLDVPGSGTAVRLQSALQVHTCKPQETAEDELFAIDYPGSGQIYMEEYDFCVEADGDIPGSSLYLRPCSDSPSQLFSIDEGVIRLGDGKQDGLCLAADPAAGIPTGGPSHLRRDMTLEACAGLDAGISKWIFGLFYY